MKNIYTFAFYPNNELCEIKIIANSKSEAEKLLRKMIHDCYFDDGLYLNDVEEYK